ncbi:MAG TPA: glycosyltransferase family 4 protein [Vicinamibacterales bacterium]|nr:glycosyltransferase family 4 protein [Vicinamibacterales bacterium]
MKLAAVIQRYGAEVAGGAEAHCRGLVHALRPAHDVEVLTTCALDYITWKNHYPAGATTEEGVRVTRFPNRRERDVRRFGAISDAVFHDDHTAGDERKWLLENGPVCPDLVAAVQSRRDVDYFLIYSYRYYTAAMAAGAVPDRAVLVPTAEDDPAISLGVFAELFRSVRGLLYLTPEEQLLVEGVSGTTKPSAIIGTGLTVTKAETRSIERFAVPAQYVFYGGRIDRNKGVDQLFRYYIWLASTWPDAPDLVLAGHQVLDIPEHPKIRYLGYVSDEEKAALLAGASIAIMPSAFESLSIFVLEAWAHGTPVLVNAKCKVLEGQCRRSQGGLYYRDLAEFAAMMRLLMSQPSLRRDLGAAGRAYVDREYSWSIAAERTNALLASL